MGSCEGDPVWPLQELVVVFATAANVFSTCFSMGFDAVCGWCCVAVWEFAEKQLEDGVST